jgi:hypothetical protein
MKRILCAVVLLLISASLSAQKMRVDSLEVKNSPLLTFNTNIALICEGDSITRGNSTSDPWGPTNTPGYGGHLGGAGFNPQTTPAQMGTSTWCWKVSQLPALKGKVTWIQNLASDGNWVDDAQGRYPTSVKPYCQLAGTTYQKVLYIPFTGGNNLYGWTMIGNTATFVGEQTAAATFAKIDSLWTTARADGCTVVGVTDPKRTDMSVSADAQRVLYNQSIRSSLDYDYLLDVDQVLTNPNLPWTGDGVHLTDTGHSFFARAVNVTLVTGGGQGSTGMIPLSFLDTSTTFSNLDNSHVPTEAAIAAYFAANSGVGGRPFTPVITLAVPLSSSATVFSYTVPTAPAINISIAANCSTSKFNDFATATTPTTFTVKKGSAVICTGTVAAGGSTLTWGTGGSITTLTGNDILSVVYSGDSSLTGSLTLTGSY